MLMFIKRLWHDAVQGGIKDNASGPQRELVYFINVYSWLAFLSLSGFGVLHIISEGNPQLGNLELLCAAVIVLNMLALRATYNIAIARFGLLATVLTALIIMLMTGGMQNTGIFWLYVFPVLAFFLAGRQGGIAWMAVLYAAIFLLFALERYEWVDIPYAPIVLRQALISLFVVTIGVAVYQRSRDKYQKEEQEIDQAKSQFVTLASHQLRTPIAAVNWFAEMLLNGDAGKLNKEQHDYTRQLYASNRRLSGMVDVMLLVSSLELNELRIRLEPTDMAALSHRSLEAQIQKEGKHDLHIEERYEDGLPRIRVDAHVMGIIMQNLFSNALKYTPKGGAVTVTIKRSPEKLTIGSKGSIEIAITDTGYGIPTSQRDKVFGKLFRADNIKIKDTDGTGLGLYSVRALLSQVGGRIWFESQEDKGTTFFVLLPIEGMKKQHDSEGKR
ncbi:MAG TPA: HAMP domain-containing sensor histidine kinase [Candidatus Saccharimonadales bacterium]|nr:HAMP domain-containing sensor histidine kinase [Candidatus Saccharimonadales bacterium]